MVRCAADRESVSFAILGESLPGSEICGLRFFVLKMQYTKILV